MFSLASCGIPNTSSTTTAEPQATPSIAPFFNDATPVRTPTSLPPTATPDIPTQTPTIIVTATPNISSAQNIDTIETVSIYDEKLNPNWSLEHSQSMTYNLSAKDVTQKGQVAIQAQPTKGFGRLFFTVKQNARDVYERRRVLGVRFWVSNSDHMIATSDLAVAIIGSNQYKYWDSTDSSVKINTAVTADAPLFSETRLYDLGINRNIPPDTWVEVIIWLDNLLYDPEYTYVTGIYIKNDELFTDTFYLDHMDLLLQAKPQ